MLRSISQLAIARPDIESVFLDPLFIANGGNRCLTRIALRVAVFRSQTVDKGGLDLLDLCR